MQKTELCSGYLIFKEKESSIAIVDTINKQIKTFCGPLTYGNDAYVIEWSIAIGRVFETI